MIKRVRFKMSFNISLHHDFFHTRAAIWRFKEENRALMRRLYGDMESTTLYREMRSTAEKSSKNFQPSNNPLNSKTNRATKVSMGVVNSFQFYFN